MAIDSAEKRKSASGIWWSIPVVTPNSSKDAEWRQQAAGLYSGIAAATPTSVISDQQFTVAEITRKFTVAEITRKFELEEN